MESSIGIFFKGYPYFKQKFDKKGMDVIKTRLLLQKANVLKGEDGAKVFYDKDLIIREGATPKRFQKTLFGQGGVQGLDNKEHLHRKEMFMNIMNKDSLNRLYDHFKNYWILAMRSWEKEKEIILFHEAEKVLLRAACAWTGVPLPDDKIAKRTRYFSTMIDSSGAVGPRHWKGRTARKKAEAWIESLVQAVREVETPGKENMSILEKFSFHRDPKGRYLDSQVVAVEIINLLRPIVAIARYIVFAALALHDYPQYKRRLQYDSNELDLHFIQEVRRFYPFFPFVAAKVNKPFDYKNIHFPEGRRVLLDLYATNHDASNWSNPGVFYAERFIDWDGSAFNFIPQGGGDHNKNHRCAGEWITIDISRIALNFLVKGMTYQVPKQDLEIDMARIPAIPKSRFKMHNIGIKREVHHREDTFSLS